ncbi:MAG: molybdopterin-dependent oxidoreductase [Acidobacteriaceae bacterium]|nr:molybdopterin-dependent oxidoreductase [Acidobacteriaceae bacterium]
MLRNSRREFLGFALATPLLGGTRELSHRPLVSVQDFAQFPSLLTPTPDFFVRNHFAIPTLDRAAYRLQMRGFVEREVHLSLADLADLPSVQLTALLECAGNGVGVGAVGCARWEGPLLRDVLKLSLRKPQARFVRFTGVDTGSETDAREVQYSRTLPLAAVLDDRTIIALRMNGEPLSPEHGAPARVLAAGRYGMDSVKWLRTVEILSDPDNSFYMTQRFRRVRQDTLGEVLDHIKIKSVIVKPFGNEPVRGSTFTAGGYAWAGPERVQRVEVRVDGSAWAAARLESRPQPFSWVAWQFEISRLRPGVHNIESRAVAESGARQPEQRDPGRMDAYELNQIQRVSFFSRP